MKIDNRFRLLRTLTGLVLAMFAYCVQATTITYTTQNLSGNTWQYSYTVTNDTLPQPIDEFTIYFGLFVYENLSVVGQAAPLDWDAIAVEPDPALPDDGFYDALALNLGIAPGTALGQFQITFDYLANGVPKEQFFEIVDPTSLAVLDSGFTVAAVPLPAAGWLMGSGLLGFLGFASRCVGDGRRA